MSKFDYSVMGFGEVISKRRYFLLGAHVKVPRIASSVCIAESCYHTVKICQIDATHLGALPEKYGPVTTILPSIS